MLIQTSPIIKKIAKKVQNIGGRTFLVGGSVRDAVLSKSSTVEFHDYDLEVFKVSAEKLEKVLSAFGSVKKVGASFGVFKLYLNNDSPAIDVALPRTERTTGPGHRDFSVNLEPNLQIEEAALRRDFTMNALMWEVKEGFAEVLDTVKGLTDIKHCVIRHVHPKRFIEDPLRPLRAMQFAGRFNMLVDKETCLLCSSMAKSARDLPVERVWLEFEKWALKSKNPSKGLQALQDMGWLSVFPELYNLVGLMQSKDYHPEGDVWEHTKYTVDAMHRLTLHNADDRKLVCMFAALCHDLGKTTTTRIENGRITSPRHESAGEIPTRQFLEQIGAPQWLISSVVPLVKNHMFRCDKLTDRSVNRLSVRLHPAFVSDLTLLIEADYAGRPPKVYEGQADDLNAYAINLNVHLDQPKPILLGRYLIELGFTPGKVFGPLLESVYSSQLDGEVTTLEEAKNLVLNFKNSETLTV